MGAIVARSPQTERALARIEDWRQAYEDSVAQPSPARFRNHSGEELVQVWLTERHLDGAMLTGDDFACLHEAWVERFNEFPGDDNGSEPYAGPEPEPAPEPPVYLGIDDDAALSIKDVARYLGCNVSTVRRHVQDGRFPQPLRPTSHRVIWRGKDVREYLEQLERDRADKADRRRLPGLKR